MRNNKTAQRHDDSTHAPFSDFSVRIRIVEILTGIAQRLVEHLHPLGLVEVGLAGNDDGICTTKERTKLKKQGGVGSDLCQVGTQ